MRLAQYFSLVMLFSLLFVSQSVMAEGNAEGFRKEISEKKKAKIKKRINKAIDKLAEKGLLPSSSNASVEESASFDDDRFKYGILGILGGILLSIILTASLKFLGGLLIILGIVFVAWAIID